MPHGNGLVRGARIIWVPAALLIGIALWDCGSLAMLPHRAMGMEHTGPLVLQVTPDSGFAKASIQAGDRIEDDPESRRLFHDQSLVDYHGPYTITIHRGGRSFQTPVDATFESGWQFVGINGATSQIVGTIAFSIAIVVAAWLFVLRPTWMTLALLLSTASPPFLDIFAIQVLPPTMRIVVQVVLSSLAGAAPWFLVVFALRFPDDRASRFPAATQAAALALAAICAALGIASSFVGLRGIFAELAYLVLTWLSGGSLGIAMAIMIGKIVRTRGVQRAKLRWAILGISVPLVFIVADTIVTARGIDIGYWEAIPQLSPIALYASIAYVLSRSRFIDPRFTINRAAMWSATAAFLVAAVAGVDWITSQFLHQRGLSGAVDAAAAIALGFFSSAIQQRLAMSLERVVFRAKHRADRRLHAIGASLAFASEQHVIESAIIADVASELKLTSAALFISNDGGGSDFRRVSSIEWGEACVRNFDANERLVRLLKSERRALDLREWTLAPAHYPDGDAEPRVAVPIFTRADLRAFALYSGHRDHTELDRSEIDLLCWLAEKCSAAFDHVEVCALRALLEVSRAAIGEPMPAG